MGVSGSGKSTIGLALASAMKIPFFDGDHFHPESNKLKMASGTALNDANRWDWLKAINQHAQNQKVSTIYACSALKQTYRDIVSENLNNIKWIFLRGQFSLIKERMMHRQNHFMPNSLLQSQFDILEEPSDALKIDITQTKDFIIQKIIDYLKTDKKNIGIIGLGVMGRNLARNIGRNNITIALYNRHVDGLEENVALNLIESYPELNNATGFSDLSDFVADLDKPRKILTMVTASAMDQVIKQIRPLLEPGDMIIDGGNSDYKLTNQRMENLVQDGIKYLGMGISGGEEGALKGPAMMPGGDKHSYEYLAPILDKIAARNKFGQACVDWIGEQGSGHFVKMIHNGIEYAEMQLLAESYEIMHHSLNMSHETIANTFEDWNKGSLQSYLLEITIDIFRAKKDGNYLLEDILDQASNKGTGAWASIAGIEHGVPFNIIASALYARYTSSFKSDRQEVSNIYDKSPSNASHDISIEEIKSAYGLARLLNHLQGFEYIKSAARKMNWNIDLATVAKVWTGGCIIRSELMFELLNRFIENTDCIKDEHWKPLISDHLDKLKKVCNYAIQEEHPSPSYGACLNYILAMKQANSSANLIQAQRDYFGAHGYKLKNEPEGKLLHHNWLSS